MSGCDGKAILEAQQGVDAAELRSRLAAQQARVAELLRRYPVKRGALLQLLWLVQEEFGWVPREGIRWAAEQAEVSAVHAFGVVEFYTMYKQAPVGRYLIQVCHNVSCHIQGAEDLIAHLEGELGIHAGETTADGLFTLLRVECLAMCGNGPAILINDEMLFGPGELNDHVEGWQPGVADVDRWLARLRQEARDRPLAPRIDSIGDIVLDTAGHPGAAGASALPLAVDYAPAAPAIKVKAITLGEAITVEALCAPETTMAVVERSDDGGTWTVIGEVDVRKAPGLPGPPGGPKQVSYADSLAIGRTAHYRLIAREGERLARPSASASVTAAPAPVAEEAKGGEG